MTIDFLKLLAQFAGNYGLAIILLTIIMRAVLWPLNVSQQRSMRQMQVLQPKLKAIQERYKSDPQKMQQKMMEFYKENKFNPMGGCLPLIVQMPIFILLYTALISPQFIQIAGDTSFMGIKRLDTTLRASAGISNDGSMGVSTTDMFGANKTATLYLTDETLENVKIKKPNNALEIQGEITPGEPVDFKISLDSFDLKFSQLDKVEKADIVITNVNTRETENVSFERRADILAASVPTSESQREFHWDIMVLIALFGASMWFSQKIMMAANTTTDPTQAAIQKSMSTFMPIMIIGTFIIIPIPAGVLLYLVTSNILQVAQTVIVNKQLDMQDAAKKASVDAADLKNAKKIEPK